MQQQKTYTFPGEGGREIKKTLAPPTNERIVKMLDVCGVKNFRELFDEQHMLTATAAKMDIGVDPEMLVKALDACLVEGAAGIDFDTLDLRISDEVVQDFFEQRSKKLIERMRLLPGVN